MTNHIVKTQTAWAEVLSDEEVIEPGRGYSMPQRSWVLAFVAFVLGSCGPSGSVDGRSPTAASGQTSDSSTPNEDQGSSSPEDTASPPVQDGDPWSGTVGEGEDTSAVEFMLERDAGDGLSGVLVIFDPLTNARVRAGAVTGKVEGNSAEWATEGGIEVEGVFSGPDFEGTLRFPGAPDLGVPPRTVPVRLHLGAP